MPLHGTSENTAVRKTSERMEGSSVLCCFEFGFCLDRGGCVMDLGFGNTCNRRATLQQRIFQVCSGFPPTPPHTHWTSLLEAPL